MVRSRSRQARTTTNAGLRSQAARGRAYTHTWDDTSVAIDLAKHKEVACWKNGCKASRGIALDGKRGLLFVGCDEGKAAVLDVTHDGKQLGSAATGKGVDIIAYSPALAHLYVLGGDSATLTILGVGPDGKLDVLGSVAVAADSHCVAADDVGHAYVCDPSRDRSSWSPIHICDPLKRADSEISVGRMRPFDIATLD